MTNHASTLICEWTNLASTFVSEGISRNIPVLRLNSGGNFDKIRYHFNRYRNYLPSKSWENGRIFSREIFVDLREILKKKVDRALIA